MVGLDSDGMSEVCGTYRRPLFDQSWNPQRRMKSRATSPGTLDRKTLDTEEYVM